MAKLTQKDEKEINRLRTFFPGQIDVQVVAAEEGGFCARVVTFSGVITEAETFSELIEMINDAIQGILRVPRKYAAYMPTYLPSLNLARHFDVLPRARRRILTLTSSGATVNRR